MKYYRKWFFGGSVKDTDPNITDYVIAYISETGITIDVEYSFTSMHDRWYTVNGVSFNTLAEAKMYVEHT